MAEQTIIGLSKEDVDVLKEVVGKSRRQRSNTASRSVSPEAGIAYGGPEVYVAKMPGSGIAGMAGVEPTYADCDVYQIDMTAAPEAIENLIGFTLRVYNPYQSAITGPQYIPILRDKAGNWYPSSSGVFVPPPDWVYVFKTGDYSAASGEHVTYDLSGGPATLTLPPSPTIGDTKVRIGFNENPAANRLTLDGGANNVNGSLAPSFGIANFYFGWFEWRYLGGTTGWSPSGAIT